jgi:hypothetical protein
MLAFRKTMAIACLTGGLLLMAVTDPRRLESKDSMSSATAALSGHSAETTATTPGDDATVWTAAATSGEPSEQPDECQRWAAKGHLAKQGCEKCAAGYPFRTDQCMFCGGVCKKKTCADTPREDCFGSPAFHECHGACMAKVAEKVQTPAAFAEKKMDAEAAVQEFDPARGVPEECRKFEARGPLAVRGCAKCVAYHPGKTYECMTCGGSCWREVCERSDVGECVKTPAFRECHKACMAMDTTASEGRSDAKLLRLQRFKRGVAKVFAKLPGIF